MSNLHLVFVAVLLAVSTAEDGLPPYIKQRCHSSDPKLLSCITESVHHIGPWLATGIPEISMPSVEPFRMDQLSISLSTGPQGYKVILKEVDISGASNFSISKLKLSEDGKPFEARVKMPQLRIASRYTSSGVLFIIPASGSGNFNGQLDGVTADLKGQVVTKVKDGERYLQVKSLDLDLHVKTVKMGVKKIFNNNRILIEATNLFLRENGQEVLKAMLPQLKAQLSKEFMRIVNQLLVNVPVSLFYVVD